MKSTYGTVISRNLSGLVVFKTKSDRQTQAMLSRKIFSESNFISECFSYIDRNIKVPFFLKYILIDLKPGDQLDMYQVCTDIFPREMASVPTPVYLGHFN